MQGGVNSASAVLQMSVLSGRSRLEHRQNATVVEVTRSDAFKVRADTAQFGSHKTVHEVQAAIQPGEQLVLDVIVNRERDFSAVWPNLGEINNAHQRNIATDGFERVLIRRFALDRQEDSVGFKA